MSPEDALAELDRWDKEFHPIKAWYWLLRWKDARRYDWRNFREFFIRGRRGWAPSDTWGLDHYLARVMGHSLQYLAEHSHGWPGEHSEWKTPEEWEAELKRQAKRLIAYSNGDYTEPTDIGPTIQRLGTYWQHLWD